VEKFIDAILKNSRYAALSSAPEEIVQVMDDLASVPTLDITDLTSKRGAIIEHAVLARRAHEAELKGYLW
jgi:hypothetical protein